MGNGQAAILQGGYGLFQNAGGDDGTVISTYGEVSTMQDVMTLRASDMGWGQIAKELGLNLGKVISSSKSGNERLAKANRQESSAKNADRENQRQTREEKTKKTEKADRAEKVERAEKVDRPERVERPERPEHPERPDRPEKIKRTGR